MARSKDYNIGDEFVCGRVKLRVCYDPIEPHSCDKCFFWDFGCTVCTRAVGNCVGLLRKDKKTVYFEEIKEETNL